MGKAYGIYLSFKESEKWMMEEISKHSSKAGFIKDVLRQYLQGGEKEKPQEKPQMPIIDIWKNL